MKEDWEFFGEGYHQTPKITISMMQNWFRSASVTMVEAFTDYINVPWSDQLIKGFRITSPVVNRALYPLKIFEYATGKLLEKMNPNLGDLLYCIAKKE